MSEFGCDVEIAENPEISISELDDRIRKGSAFVIGAPGMSRKERRLLKREALCKLKEKSSPLKYHLVAFDGAVFEVLE